MQHRLIFKRLPLLALPPSPTRPPAHPPPPPYAAYSAAAAWLIAIIWLVGACHTIFMGRARENRQMTRVNKGLEQAETIAMVGMLKLSCDAAHTLNHKAGRIAFVFRNHLVRVVDGMTRPVPMVSALERELPAIRDACLACRSQGLIGTFLESDCKKAVDLSVSELVPPWNVASTVWDTRQIAREMGLIIGCLRREANRAAHSVVKLASLGSLPANWLSVLPPWPLPCHFQMLQTL